jgi:hypothetical protein
MKNYKLIPSTIVLISIVICSISCNTQSKDQNSANAGVLNEWPKSIQLHKVGLVNTGIKLNDAINILSNYFSVSMDSIYNEEEESYTYVVYVKNDKGEVQFCIHPSADIGNGKEIVYSYEVLSQEYSIDKTNISVGDNVSELRKAYQIQKSYFDYDNGLFMFASDFDGCFGIELDDINKNALDQNNFENFDSIPGTFEIKSIIVY